jgi:hypothetical protein
MPGHFALNDLSTDLFTQELKSISSPIDDNLQINLKVGGGLVVEGFKSISTLQLQDLCRKYGKQFSIKFNKDAKTITINFSVIPDFFVKKTTIAPISSLQQQLKNQVDSHLNINDKIVLLTNGVIHKEIQTKSCVLLELKSDEISSDVLRSISNIHEVINITILPSLFQITLMKENDSRTSLAFLKEHRPNLFTSCVNVKRKSSACKTFMHSSMKNTRAQRRKRRGYARWHLW